MKTQTAYFFKVGLIVVSMMTLGACRSSGEIDETPAVTPTPAATSAPAPRPAGPTAAELREQEALRTTVFYFDFDVAEFKPADRETLTFHARSLASDANKRIRLEGHADERGTREYNLALGERRANGIMNFLIVNGASRSQIETVSYGEERPAQTGSTDSAHTANRRVEIVNR